MKNQKNPSAVALGRLGGSATSKRKANAARENAKLGGWPKGKKRGKRKRSTDANVIAHAVVKEAITRTSHQSQ